MSLRITRARVASPAEWDSLWRECEHATYFQGRAWAETWSEYSRGRLKPAPEWIEFSDGIETLLPITKELAFGGLLHRCWLSVAGTYGGWLSETPLSHDHIDLIVAYLQKQNPNLYWRHNPYQSPPPIVNAKRVIDHTDVLDLSDGFASIFQRWGKGNRSAISKAIRNGVTIKRASQDSDWQDYYNIYLDSQQRWGDHVSVRHQSALFEILRRRGAEAGGVELWVAAHEGRSIAGALCLYSSRIATYWHGAALASYFELRPVNLLLHDAIRDATERGFSWFDFCPSGGHAGVEAFKQRFTTQRKSADVITTESTILRLLRAPKLMFRTRSGR